MRRDEYATMFRVEETHWWYKALHRLIFQTLEAELPDWREKEIVDVGCGTGAILKQLGNPEKNVGIDLAPEAISFCRQRGLNNVQQGDIHELLQKQNFKIRRLTYWTTLLFPLAVAARTLGGSKMGRDFETDKVSF